MVVAGVIACALVSAGGMVASYFVKSPQQAMADTAPPAPTVITAMVQRKVLQTTIVTRGRISAGQTMEITPVIGGMPVQVLTGSFIRVGQEVKPGRVLLAVSGRPLFALTGNVPAYRDLGPGARGDDVAQLQSALRHIGHSTGGDPAGYFGDGTEMAVRSMYRDAGFEPLTTGQADTTQISDAAADVTTARNEVSRLKRLVQAGKPAAPGEVPLSDQLTSARTRLANLQKTYRRLVNRIHAVVPVSEIAFVPNTGASVVGLSAGVGDLVKAPLLRIATGKLSVQVFLTPDQADPVPAGTSALVVAEASGEKFWGKVSSIGEVVTDTQPQPGRPAPGTPYRTVKISTAKNLPARAVDQDVRVTLTATRGAEASLVVPLSAVSSHADGTTTVSVVDGNGGTRSVEVDAGTSGDGFVAVDPRRGTLSEGDRVIIGQQE